MHQQIRKKTGDILPFGFLMIEVLVGQLAHSLSSHQANPAYLQIQEHVLLAIHLLLAEMVDDVNRRFSQISTHRLFQTISVMLMNLFFVYHFLKFVFCFTNTFSIIGVYNEYQSLGVLEIVTPKWTNFILTTNVPYGEAYILIFYSFDIET